MDTTASDIFGPNRKANQAEFGLTVQPCHLTVAERVVFSVSNIQFQEAAPTEVAYVGSCE